MSVDGKNGRVITKLAVKESNVTTLGYKQISFLHEASQGDSVIDLTSLVAPAISVSNGYLAPSLADLTGQNLKQFKENFKLISNGKALTQFVDYIITGATIIKLLVDADEGQIFEGVMNYAPRTGVSLADAQPLVVTGVLALGDTDFNVGTAFELNKFPSMQVGSVSVHVDGQLAVRNTGNNPAGAGVEGDYYEVNAGGGVGVIIRFNTPDLSKDRGVVVKSIGSLVQAPDGSEIELIEALQGQVDAMIPILSETSGAPESSMQGAPNNVNLKAFGDRVLTNEKDILALLDKVVIAEENVFSATLPSVGTSPISQSTTFIQGIVWTGARIVVTFVPGFFTETPAITVTAGAVSGVSGRQASFISAGAATFELVVEDSVGADSAGLLHIVVQRQGADYKQPKKLSEI